jgi:hypothetical protein
MAWIHARTEGQAGAPDGEPEPVWVDLEQVREIDFLETEDGGVEGRITLPSKVVVTADAADIANLRVYVLNHPHLRPPQ